MDQSLFSFVSLVLSVVLSIVAVLVSFYTFRSQKLDVSYADIDEAYVDILKLAIEYPALRDRSRTTTYFHLREDDDFRIRYESYAFICWNIVETIFDRQGDKKAKYGISPTWLPVLLEENRLHYHWFCRNVRLFKERFRRFVMEELNRVAVSEGTIQDLSAVYQRMLEDFPPQELMSQAQMERLMADGQYKLYLATHEAVGSPLGYALMFEPKAPKIAWLDYIAIDTRMRNMGYGTTFLHGICEHLSGQRQGIMLEVEPATSDDPEILAIQLRRIAFYERNGAKRLDIDYLFPAQDNPYPLYLYYKPIAKLDILPKEQIKAMIRGAYDYIHDDVTTRHATLRRFIATIRDHPL